MKVNYSVKVSQDTKLKIEELTAAGVKIGPELEELINRLHKQKMPAANLVYLRELALPTFSLDFPVSEPSTLLNSEKIEEMLERGKTKEEILEKIEEEIFEIGLKKPYALDLGFSMANDYD
jgi:hypothetical protein